MRDSLHAQRFGGAVTWNGINEVVRRRWPEWRVAVRHETWTRSDALLAADGAPPGELLRRAPPLGAYPPASQFSTAVFEADADAFVLSIQPDLLTGLVRHRGDGWLLYPESWRTWPEADRAWLRAAFEPAPALSVEASIANFAAIVARLRARTAAPILIFNVSAAVPGDDVHAYEGLDETLATRIRRFNLALTELSAATGVSVIDVDRIVARAGAGRVKLDALHLNAEGCALVAEETARVLDELGCFAEGPA
ncbi:MAG TPA: SGNH/GDSL hydrolase family protein [Caulobacteraceae bacterium]